ncbi:C-type lectin domain family 4 member E-like [Poecilia reticulata]|uniref:C-type lectin domain family 4 member E-like n=1 Tax=Poecilia reticulata TaxID=8081 RepID=UPI0004A4FF91|nr:PREDICTED: C-type lectin domain family 4 member E-like [Poecilia reticulata]
MERQQNFNRDGQGGSVFGNYKVIIVCLGLLNAVLFVAAVVLGFKCAQAKQASLLVSHSAASEVIGEVTFLRSNHSDVIGAEKHATRALANAIKNHTQLKEQIEQQKIINDGFQKQVEALQVEKTNLQANISALGSTCGKCPLGWLIFNSSCYFFSYTESTTVKKNWHKSREDCIKRGADLVVIDNQHEQEFVSHTINDMRSGQNVWTSGFWIGLTDMETEGTWVWLNNVTEVEQRYWMDGEPNDMHTGEDCGIAVYSDENPWKTRYDGVCHQRQLQWICEIDQS